MIKQMIDDMDNDAAVDREYSSTAITKENRKELELEWVEIQMGNNN